MTVSLTKYLNIVLLRSVKWAILFSLVYVAIIITAYNKLYCFNFWSNFAENPGSFNYFCEHTHYNSFIKQPLNTLSNVAFVFLGLVLLFTYIRQLKLVFKPLAVHYFGTITGFVLFYTGIVSTFYHASLTEISHFLDISGCYMLVTLPIMFFTYYLIKKHLRKKAPHLLKNTIAVYIICNLFFALNKWWINYYAVFSLFALLGLFIVISLDGVWFMYKNKLLASAMMLNIISVSFYFVDSSKILNWPDSYIQFHSGWHILSAITFFLYFLSIQDKSYEG